MQSDLHSDTDAYLAAIARAERRARSSYFDQHIIKDCEAGYIIIDEGDYPVLPGHLVDRIVHSFAGGLIDED